MHQTGRVKGFHPGPTSDYRVADEGFVIDSANGIGNLIGDKYNIQVKDVQEFIPARSAKKDPSVKPL